MSPLLHKSKVSICQESPAILAKKIPQPGARGPGDRHYPKCRPHLFFRRRRAICYPSPRPESWGNSFSPENQATKQCFYGSSLEWQRREPNGIVGYPCIRAAQCRRLGVEPVQRVLSTETDSSWRLQASEFARVEHNQSETCVLLEAVSDEEPLAIRVQGKINHYLDVGGGYERVALKHLSGQ